LRVAFSPVRFSVFLLASLLARGLRFFTIAILIYYYGESIRNFIECHLGWLSVAFVILLVLGFWIVGRGFGKASQSGSEPGDEEE
jgi:putative Mn2+ efflux pump MntP